MEILGNQEIGVETLRSSEKSEFLDLIDRSFGCGPGSSMRQVCPAALSDRNRAHQFVLRLEGHIVSTAVALRRSWIASSGPVDVAVLGCFATEPAHRGQGLSRRLQTQVIEKMAASGAELALLWAEQPGLYTGRGFRPCGQELHLDLDGFPSDPPQPGRIRRAERDDAEALDRLYRQHPWHCVRQPEDWQEFLAPEVSEVIVEERAGQLVAYAALGKGIDFPGYIHEFGGDRDGVHRLWSRLRSMGATHALVPGGAEDYLHGAAAGCARRSQSSALGLALSPAMKQMDWQQWNFSAWGFDSA